MTETVNLGYEPREWQRVSHENMRRFTVLPVHRRGGKTRFAMMELIDRALGFTLPLGRFGYVAPFRNQAKQIVWDEIKYIVRDLIQTGRCEAYEADLLLRFPHNGARIQLYGADRPNTLRGSRFDFVVLDEVAQMDPALWSRVVRHCLADKGRLGDALFIGTVDGVDLFSERYHAVSGKAAEGDPDYYAKVWDVFATEAIDAEEIEDMREDMSENEFERELMCNFSVEGDDQIVSTLDARLATEREWRPQDIEHAPRVLGVDPARYGSDRSVIRRRQGLQTWPSVSMRGGSTSAVGTRVAEEIEEFQPDAVFIDSGQGGGVIDYVRDLNLDVIEVPFSGAPSNPRRYLNRRAEMWWRMREWFKSGGAIEKDETLLRELTACRYFYNPRQQIQAESKDELIKRLRFSPDEADALALTFASKVSKRSDVVRNPQQFRPFQARQG